MGGGANKGADINFRITFIMSRINEIERDRNRSICNGLQQIHGCGFGSTLIHKDLIKKFKFWYTLEKPIKHSDVLFYMDLHNYGHMAYVDTDIIIPPYNSDWKSVEDI